jgi:ligand-binding sensor domain-containing protein
MICIKRIFLLFLFFCSVSAFAQQPFLRNYSVSDGLPSNEVYDVFNDSKGFLWFATDAGVSRYDGYHFLNFTSRDGMPDNTVFGFYEDSKGRIWFRSYSGLLSYFDGSKIICPAVNNELKKILPGNAVVSLYVDVHDTVWLGLSGSVSALRILPGFATIDKHKEGLQDDHIIREMEPGQFLFSGRNHPGIPAHTLFFSYGSVTPVVIDSLQGNPANIFCTRLSNGETMINAVDATYIINGNNLRKEIFTEHIIRFVPADGKQFWACRSYGKGVSLVELTNKKDAPQKNFLNGYTVTDCSKDHEGGIWFTTLEKGIFYMPYPEVEEMTNYNLATGEKIISLTSFPGNRLAALTSNGIFFRPDSSAYNSQQLLPGQNYFISMRAAASRFTIMGKPSMLFDPALQKKIIIHDSAGPVALNAIIPYDKKNFCGVSTRDIFLIDAVTGDAKLLYHLLPERVRCICRGDGDTLWLGGLTGLWMFVPGKIPVSMSVVSPLLGQRIDFLYYDFTRHRLWMSTKGNGLLLKEGSRVFNPRPELPATCRSISTDADGNLWIATNAGAFCMSETAKGFSFREFSRRNGLSTNDIIDICRIGDTIWMAAPDRVLRFRLDNFPQNTATPPLIMRYILADGDTIAPWPDGSCHEFAPGDNAITFSFTGLSYKSFGNVHYRFRLIGADSSWKETQSTEAVFYGLSPGEYRFSVYAYNNDRIGSAKPMEFCFLILPPWWQRWWFRIPVFLLIITAVIIFARFRIRRSKQKQLFNQRLVEMEMTALRAQMSPHFIFNAINSIHNFVLKGEKSASATYLSKFARLIRNVLENSAQRQITLAKELETLQLYMEIEQMRFSDGFDFSIETGPEIDPVSIMIIPLLLQPYVENAIWHGLLHKKTKGSVHVSVKAEGNMLRCIIDDDGVGRAQAALNKQHRLAGSSSMGGEISLRRLNLLNSLYGKKYAIEYTDKKNADGSPAGTRVELLIPGVNKNEII